MPSPTDFLIILGQNLLFHELLGMPSVSLGTKKEYGFLRLGILTLFFCTIVSGTMAAVRGLIPETYQKLLFPLCNAILCGLLDLLILGILHFLPPRYTKQIKSQLHSAAFSGAVLGTVLLSTEYTHEIRVAFRYGFRTGLGFLIACALLRLAAPAFSSPKMPRAMRGWKGIYLYAALLSAAVYCMFPSIS